MAPRHVSFIFVCLLITVSLAIFPSSLRAQSDTYVWAGGSGNWGDGVNWGKPDGDPYPAAAPSDAGADVYIDGGQAGVASVVLFLNSTNGTQYACGHLTIDAGDTLTNAGNFLVYQGIVNNGAFTFRGDPGQGWSINFATTAGSITGTGVVGLTEDDQKIYTGSPGRITIGAGETIQGRGNLGYDQTNFTNSGLVDANIAGATLVLQPGDNTVDFTNTASGIARASNGGTLELAGNFGSALFTGGSFQARYANSTLLLTNNPQLSNTTLVTCCTSAVVVADQAALTNVTLNGTLNINNNALLEVSGTLTNNGTLNLNASSSSSYIQFVTDTTLAGNGVISLNGPEAYLRANNKRVTIGSGQLIVGQGNVGANNTAFTNSGIINANVPGGTLIVQPGSTDFSNTTLGLVEATGGGNLQLNGTNATNTFTGGSFQALNGSQITLTYNPLLSNTTLSTTGTGAINVLDRATLTNVTLNGVLNANDNTIVTLAGTLINNGTINLDSSGNGAAMLLTGNVAFAGTGRINMSGVNDVIEGSETYRLTVGAGQTILGQGNLGGNNTAITNAGVVNANVAGAALIIQPGGEDFTNTGAGYAFASGGGNLQLNGTNATNTFTGGSFQALNGSQITLTYNPLLSNTTLSTSGAGVVTVLDRATLTNVNFSGALNCNDNTVLSLAGTLTNNGTINLYSSGGGVDLSLQGPVTLAGTGTINFNGTNDVLGGIYNQSPAQELLTIGSGQTITGQGNLGAGHTTFSNNGIINANIAGATLVVQPDYGSGYFQNNAGGLIEATNGATLSVVAGSQGILTNNGTVASIGANSGTTAWTIGAGGLSNLSNGTLTGGAYEVIASSDGAATMSVGGTVTTNNATVIIVGANATFTDFQGVANNQGTIVLGNSAVSPLAGAFVNAGKLELGSVSVGSTASLTANTSFTQTAAGTLMGSGQIFANSIMLAGTIVPGGSVNAATGFFALGTGTLVLNGGSAGVTIAPSAVLDYTLGGVVMQGGQSSFPFARDTPPVAGEIMVNAHLTLGGTVNIEALPGFGAGRYDLLDYSTDDGVSLAGLEIGDAPAGYHYAFDLSTPGEVDLLVTSNVPEPGSCVLLAVGVLAFGFIRQARR